MSPPTRDTDPDPHLQPRNPQDEKYLQEIKLLRTEINSHLDQILKLEEYAQNGNFVCTLSFLSEKLMSLFARSVCLKV